MSSENNQDKAYELSRDERALIYQHVQELQAEAPGFGPVSVTVMQTKDEKFHLKYVAQESVNFETFGNGFTIYEASLMAKNELLKKIRLASDSQNSPERALQIFSILHGSTLH